MCVDYRGFKIQIQYSSLGGYGSFKTIVSHENATLFTSLGVSNTDVFDNIDKCYRTLICHSCYRNIRKS